jgi:5-methylcytosine-specific restriction endonuclease McrA
MPYKTPELRRANYLANKELVKQQTATWSKAHPESRRASYMRWAEANPEKVKANRKAHYEANHQAALEYSAKFRAENPKLVKERLAEWKRQNPDKVSALQQKRRTAKTKAGGAYTSAQWIALCEKYHNKCPRCDKKKKLTPDHVVPVSKGGTSNISNIQPLCGPCNSSKGAKTVDYRREINNGRRCFTGNRNKCRR